ncbi:MAG: ammonium transporter [Pirellulaceae bacterium]|nr:ammonium transporter [Pirellulaceae bacterium]
MIICRQARWCCRIALLAFTAILATSGNSAHAQETKTEPPTAASVDKKIDDKVGELEAKIGDAALAGHNSWMLTSSALVLFMTAPGLAMFYSGLVRKKNVLGVMMQCVFLMGMNTVIWALFGYSLSFGGTNPYIGNADYLFMKGVEPQMVEVKDDAGNLVKDDKGNVKKEIKMPMCSDAGVASGTPIMTHMLFQGMFFIITPALICGAFAERMKFSTMVVFSALWGIIVYCPLCHWVWDGGILGFVPIGNEGGNGILGGALDFAGGTVVHISSGVSALVCALVLDKRLGYGTEPMPPHNLTYTVLGAAMLWVGWFGFNAGSELGSDRLSSTAFCVTHFAAAAGALAWAGMEWITRGKPSVLGAASGLVAGLVCITPASGFVQPMPALLLGVAAGVVCFFACTKLKAAFGYDDSLDAFGVHGVGGTLGAILTGVFATAHVCDPTLISNYNPVGLIDGRPELLLGQLVAVVITWVFAGAVTFVLLKILDATMGLRVSKEEELQGLDQSQHGEEGYIFL